MSTFYDIELRCEVQALVGVYADDEEEAREIAQSSDLSDIEITNMVDSEVMKVEIPGQVS